MNEVIKALYEIEAQAGELMEEANASRQAMQEEKKRQMEDINAELEAEFEGRITILKSRLGEEAEASIQQITEKGRQNVEQFQENYQKNFRLYARKIVERIIEV